MNVCIEYYSSLLSGLSTGGYRAGCIDAFFATYSTMR